MVDIYNEIEYIKYVISKGLSDRWRRDSTLLAKYYKMEGLSAQEADDKISEKIDYKFGENASKTIYRKDKDDIIKNAYSSEVKLREIKRVIIPKEVVDWFVGLIDYKIDEETVKELRRLYGSSRIGISENIFNYNRVKFLFTLYVWSLIQEKYVSKCNRHDLKTYRTKFLHDAGFKGTFKFENELYLLNKLGFIKVWEKQNRAKTKREEHVEASFMDDDKYRELLRFGVVNEEEYKKDGKEYVVLSNDNEIMLDNDLHNPGYWLDKYYYGTFKCDGCGKIVPKYRKGKGKGKKNGDCGANAKKYCDECLSEIRKKGKENERVITVKDRKVNCRKCEDCGKWFFVKKMGRPSTRCDKCEKENLKTIKREWARAHKKSE